MLSVQNLTKDFGQKRALDVESFSIQPGECVGIVGNNGAGKTTLLRSILDLIKPTSGVVRLGGHEVHKSDNWKRDVHAFLDESFLIDFLKPMEYLEFIAKALSLPKTKIQEALDYFSPFTNEDILENKKMIQELSTGSKVRVGVLSTFLGDPKMIILDEPFAHLDPSSQSYLLKMIKEKTAEGVTVVLSSHNLQSVVDVCLRVVLIEKGQIKLDLENSDESLQTLESYFEMYGG